METKGIRRIFCSESSKNKSKIIAADDVRMHATYKYGLRFALSGNGFFSKENRI